MNKVYTLKAEAIDAAALVTAHAVSIGSSARFYASKTEDGFIVKRAADGYATVVSDESVECHASSTYRRTDLSRSGGDSSPEAKAKARILAYWESEGIARYVTGGAGGGGHWEARDILHSGDWMPFASQGEETSGERVVFSHVKSADNGGAWCACNLLPENGAANDNRKGDDMMREELSADAVYLLEGWRGYALAVTLRKASLARLTH
jgi:hypothetical protein